MRDQTNVMSLQKSFGKISDGVIIIQPGAERFEKATRDDVLLRNGRNVAALFMETK